MRWGKGLQTTISSKKKKKKKKKVRFEGINIRSPTVTLPDVAAGRSRTTVDAAEEGRYPRDSACQPASFPVARAAIGEGKKRNRRVRSWRRVRLGKKSYIASASGGVTSQRVAGI